MAKSFSGGLGAPAPRKGDCMKRVQRLFMVPAGFLMFVGATAWALPTPETSLDTCQNTVKAEGKKFVQNTVAAIGTCLQAVAKDVIKSNVAISSTTSKICVAQFRKLNDTRTPPADVDLEAKLRAKIDGKCVPGGSNTHTFSDIKGMLGGTAEDIQTSNINLWCKHFGGDGSIDSVTEWEDCIAFSHDCDAVAAILAQFPRALEWITALHMPGANMDLVPSPAGDPTRTSDARAAAADFIGALDPNGDGIANPTCGGEAVACATTCCYTENGPPDSPQTSCIQYTGPAAATVTFTALCNFTPSVPGGPTAHIHNAVPGPCGAAPSPVYGNICVAGGGTVDSSCP